MNARRVVPCRATAAYCCATPRKKRAARSENRHRQILHRRASKLSPLQRKWRARFCSTGFPVLAVAVWRASNVRGIRSATVRFWFRPQRTRNDSRLQSRSKSPSQQQRNARSFSCGVQSFTGRECSNIFFRLDIRRSTGRDLGRWNAINAGC